MTVHSLQGMQDISDVVVSLGEHEMRYAVFVSDGSEESERAAPEFERLSQGFGGVAFVKLDADANADFVQSESVKSIPSFFFYHGTDVVEYTETLDMAKASLAQLMEH